MWQHITPSGSLQDIGWPLELASSALGSQDARILLKNKHLAQTAYQESVVLYGLQHV